MLKRLRSRSQAGQAAVETAIVTPLMVFFILGILQLTLMQQASLMLEYAAFNAARTGSVWNMDVPKMRNAALISLLPTINPTPDVKSLIQAAVTGIVENLVFKAVLGRPLVDVEVMSPKEADFGKGKEIVFDDPTLRLQTQMTIRVSYLFDMKIPFANAIIFDEYWASNASMSLQGKDSAIVFRDATKVMISRFKKGDFSKICKYTGIDSNQMYKLRRAADLTGKYYMPLVTTYTIRMQSNPFKTSPDGKEKWAAPDKDTCS
jgi:hypothetical protein